MEARASSAVERFFKHLGGWLLALAWWRPGRRPRARALLTTATDVFVVRIDNRVGEALLTTPLVERLAARFRVHLVAHEKCARVLEGLPGVHALHAVSRGDALWGLLSARTRALRRLARGAVVVSAANTSAYSGTQALFARAVAGGGCLVGPATGPAGVLADVAVAELPGTTSEVAQRLHLLAPLGVEGPAPLRFREPRPSEAVRAFHAALPSPFAVVNPGGRLGERRVPPAVFARAARLLREAGVAPVVTWGPGEEALARDVVRDSLALRSGETGAPAGADTSALLAPPTSLDDLAFLMRAAKLVVCNNTGPMHLAVAVGAPTVALFFRIPVERWGHPAAPHQLVDLTPHAGDEARLGEVVEAALRRSLGGAA